MLVIRLRRIGRTHDPHYRIVVAEHTAPVQGKFLAEVGHYHPKSKELGLQQDQFLAWMERGAKPSNTVAKLAERSGLAHPHIVIKEYKGQPKKKAQAASSVKPGSSPAVVEVPTEASPTTVDEEPTAPVTETPAE